MTLKDVISLAEAHLAEYLKSVGELLASQRQRFAPTVPESGQYIAGTGMYDLPSARCDTNLLVFVAINVFAGSTLYSMLPRPHEWTFATVFVVTVTLWSLFSTVCDFACEYLGGSARTSQTVSASLQVLSTVYVLSNAAAFVAAYAGPSSFGHDVKTTGLYWAMITYSCVQFVLLVGYWPPTLLALHQITSRSTLRRFFASCVLIFLCALFTFLGFVLFGLRIMTTAEPRHFGT